MLSNTRIMNKNDFCSVCKKKKKLLSMLSIAFFSLLTIFCEIGYMFFPSQVHLFSFWVELQIFLVFGKVVASVEREKIGDPNGPRRLGKMLWEGVPKRRDKNLLQNWAGSHARKAG
jgi:hypothetical protein